MIGEYSFEDLNSIVITSFKLRRERHRRSPPVAVTSAVLANASQTFDKSHLPDRIFG